MPLKVIYTKSPSRNWVTNFFFHETWQRSQGLLEAEERMSMCNAKTNLDAKGTGPCATDQCVACRALKAMAWDFTALQLQRLLLVAFCTLNRCK